MHIPNGYLSDPICAATSLAAAASLSVGVWRARRLLTADSYGQFAAVSAGVFALQMLNVPVDHGASGHLIGAALATAILGPWLAMLAMSVVLVIQATAFGDGGLLTLGANVLNMGVIAPWTAWCVWRMVGQNNSAQRAVWLSGLAAFTSVLAAAIACSLELALAGTAPLGDVLPAMLRAHCFIAIGEGLVTAVAVWALSEKTHFAMNPTNKLAWRASWSYALFTISACIAILLAPWASSLPDGLEAVAQRLQFENLATAGFTGFVPDYAMPGINSLPLAVALGGLLGVMMVIAAAYCAGRMTVLRPSKRDVRA
jgi:cobalt/nickel transport system permease protein